MKGFPEFKNLVEMASSRATDKGDATVMSFLGDSGNEEGTLSFAGLDESATKIAAGLVEKGLAGRNLMLLYTPGLDYVRAFFGCLYAGCVPVPAYPPMGARDIERLKRVVQDCDAGAILSSSMLLPMIEAWVANPSNGINIPCIATDAMMANVDASGFTLYDSSPDDIAFLQYTSGSTGHPKGVMVSHGNIMSNEAAIYSGFGHDSDTVILGWLPFHHDMGLIGNMLHPIYAGVPSVVMSPMDFLRNPASWLQMIHRYRATTSGGPNFAYDLCLAAIRPEHIEGVDLSSWRVAFNGSEMIQAVANARVAKFSVVVGGSYGAGNYAMCGRGLDPHFIFAWPNNKTAVMGGAQAGKVLRIVAEQKQKSLGMEPDENVLNLLEQTTATNLDKQSTALYGTAHLWDDGLIDPRDTRKILGFVLNTHNEAKARPLQSNAFGIARF